jgi:hypothetical protein
MTDELLKKTYAYLPVWDVSSDSANSIGFTRKTVEEMTVEEKAFVIATAQLDWRNKEHAETCKKELVKLIGEKPI